MSEIAAIILAAGKGTRMKSDKAKVLYQLAGKPMIQRVVNTALSLDFHPLCIVVGHQKDAVIASLDEYDDLVFVEQKEQLGTGHAVLITEPIFKDFSGDIIILAGDVPLLQSETLRNLKDHHQITGAACTVLTSFLDDAEKYGRIIRNPAGEIVSIVEYKDATPEQRKIREFNTGIWCFKADALFRSIHRISNHNNQKEYYLTDTLELLVKDGETVGSVVLENPVEAAGVNSQEHLAELEQYFLEKIRRHWLNSGVMIHNPSTVYIGEDVRIEPDVTIDSHCSIKGKSQLEKGCHIGSHSHIQDSIIGQESILKGYNIIINANIPDGEIIGWRETVHEDLV